MCNIFDQDVEKMAESAFRNVFSGIDQSIDHSFRRFGHELYPSSSR